MEQAGLQSKPQRMPSATKPAWAAPWDAHLAVCKSRGSNLHLQEPRAAQTQPLGQDRGEQGWAESTARQFKVETGKQAGSKEGRLDLWICSPRPWGGLGSSKGGVGKAHQSSGLKCYLFSPAQQHICCEWFSSKLCIRANLISPLSFPVLSKSMCLERTDPALIKYFPATLAARQLSMNTAVWAFKFQIFTVK